jgi:hypothetical protein
MRSHTTAAFKNMLANLPKALRQQARKAYRLFRRDSMHPGLRFKRVHDVKPVYSVRITRGYRAVGIKNNQDIIWFWIGTHDEYERLIASL